MENDPDFQSSIKKLSRLHVYETESGRTEFKSGRWSELGYWIPHSLYYDPYTIVYNKDNDKNVTTEYNSNASGFYHELGHFLSRLKLGAKKHAENSGINKDGEFVPDGTRFHSPEEKGVILGPEKDFNIKHGEPTRDNHYGEPSDKKTKDPTENSNTKGKAQSARYLED